MDHPTPYPPPSGWLYGCCKSGVAQVRTVQICSVQIRADQDCVAQISTGQTGPPDVRKRQVDTAQIDTGQIGASTVRQASEGVSRSAHGRHQQHHGHKANHQAALYVTASAGGYEHHHPRGSPAAGLPCGQAPPARIRG